MFRRRAAAVLQCCWFWGPRSTPRAPHAPIFCSAGDQAVRSGRAAVEIQTRPQRLSTASSSRCEFNFLLECYRSLVKRDWRHSVKIPTPAQLYDALRDDTYRLAGYSHAAASHGA